MSVSSAFGFLGDEGATWNLAFIGGFVDAVGFVKLHHLFTSSITGNLVVAMAAVETSAGAVCRIVVSLSFFLSAAIAYSFALRLKCVYEIPAHTLAMYLFTCELASLGITLVVWALLRNDVSVSDVSGSANDWPIILVGSLLSGSMGIHNVAAKESIANCPATTVMTTTLIIISGHFSNSLNYFLAKHSFIKLDPVAVSGATNVEIFSKKFDDAFANFMKTVKPLLCFIIGALVGSVAVWNISCYALTMPIGICLVLIGDILSTSFKGSTGKTSELKDFTRFSDKTQSDTTERSISLPSYSVKSPITVDESGERKLALHEALILANEAGNVSQEPIICVGIAGTAGTARNPSG